MQDLFPGSLHPEALRDDILPFLRPVFFAIYPADEDRLRIAGWQKQLCFGLRSAITLRPLELLHVSVAECGEPNKSGSHCWAPCKKPPGIFPFSLST